MKLRDLAQGASVFLGVIVAGYVSTSYVDKRFALRETTPAPAQTSGPAPSACVGEDGSWKNWPWPNVPALSPKCR
ncbi:hypothetical protein TSA1_07885 [Bradyrhizobium nitroreducens]|uniref:Uncharacterized protein n=1 Tax=Bradyrhizobium nitroreducens TaxID=709803 RepID=A0A2M6U7V6_9BRAD|nr:MULTISPECIES: hypothetical protein [Bradyrhizobium]PIT00700.1 hypothetical protein TSA1_07885 [Bradyrhizobium nitroreducens]TQF42174.1 hypothetical protein UNPF46_05935 [Bradyrhizobium sp. UNPF46]